MVVALVIVIPFRYFIAEPFLVEGASMEPNFHTADYLIVTKIFKAERGDIVVLVPPYERRDSWRNYIPFLDQRKKYIKRLIGLPNEEVKMKDGKIFIKKKGQNDFKELKEPYIKNINFNSQQIRKLNSHEYFVLGDNRPNSRDSEEFGPINKEDVIGEPLFRLLPITQIGIFPESFNFDKL